MPYGSSPGMVIACGGVRRRARRPVWSGACGIAGRRIACHKARRRIACGHIPAHIGDLPSLRWLRSGAPNARHLPCPGPTYACSRRRHLRFTNIYSFTLPWRCITARSAARLRRGVGPPSTRIAHAYAHHPKQRRSMLYWLGGTLKSLHLQVKMAPCKSSFLIARSAT